MGKFRVAWDSTGSSLRSYCVQERLSSAWKALADSKCFSCFSYAQEDYKNVCEETKTWLKRRADDTQTIFSDPLAD